jgi:hypothetical protein
LILKWTVCCERDWTSVSVWWVIRTIELAFLISYSWLTSAEGNPRPIASCLKHRWLIYIRQNLRQNTKRRGRAVSTSLRFGRVSDSDLGANTG